MLISLADQSQTNYYLLYYDSLSSFFALGAWLCGLYCFFVKFYLSLHWSTDFYQFNKRLAMLGATEHVSLVTRVPSPPF